MTAAKQAPVPVIAIDGPSGAGKGTLAQRLALHLGWHYLDSGAVYRVLALEALRLGLLRSPQMDIDRLVEVASHLSFSCRPTAAGDSVIHIGSEDVSDELRSEEVSAAASRIAAVDPIRTALLSLQRRFRRAPGLVADGRDMGSRVFADAALKIFLTASPQARAQRRYKQLRDKGFSVNLSELKQAIDERDERDRSRSASPLRASEEAVVVDSSSLSGEETLARVLVEVDAVFARPA